MSGVECSQCPRSVLAMSSRDVFSLLDVEFHHSVKTGLDVGYRCSRASSLVRECSR
jgi:hypothetical protein